MLKLLLLIVPLIAFVTPQIRSLGRKQGTGGRNLTLAELFNTRAGRIVFADFCTFTLPPEQRVWCEPFMRSVAADERGFAVNASVVAVWLAPDRVLTKCFLPPGDTTMICRRLVGQRHTARPLRFG
ncbi:hypothetical protein RI367_006908 [Sorochytrium milnesiophthora]